MVRTTVGLVTLAILGVLVPEIAHTQDLPAWTVEEELRFLVAEPSETSFPDIDEILLGPEGRMYVGLVHLRQVRVFDSQGRLEVAFGSPGNNPGEMGSIGHMGWIGESLYVVDATFRRIVLFGPDGTPEGALPMIGAQPGMRAPIPDRLLPEGGALFVSTERSPPPAPKSVATLFKYGTLLNASLDLLLRLPIGSETRTIVLGQAPTQVGFDSPFAQGPLYSLAPDAGDFVVLERPAPASETSGEYVLTKRTGSGEVVFERTYAYEPEAVDGPGILGAYARGLAGALGLAEDVALAEIQNSFDLPAFAPPFTAVRLATDGSIWLREWEGVTLGRSWRVFDPEGDPVARVTLPEGVRVLTIAEGTVYGTVRVGERLRIVRLRVGSR